MRRIIFTNNTRLNYNKYTIGSGVGSISSSNRAALKRRASKSCCNNNENIQNGIRYIKVFFRTDHDIIQISQLAVYSNNINIAPGGTSSAANLYDYGSITYNPINTPIDGILSSREFPDIYHSIQPATVNDYWLLDLGQENVVDRIVYYNRINNNIRAIGMLIETYDSTYDNNFPNNSVPLNQFTLDYGFIQSFDL